MYLYDKASKNKNIVSQSSKFQKGCTRGAFLFFVWDIHCLATLGDRCVKSKQEKNTLHFTIGMSFLQEQNRSILFSWYPINYFYLLRQNGCARDWETSIFFLFGLKVNSDCWTKTSVLLLNENVHKMSGLNKLLKKRMNWHIPSVQMWQVEISWEFCVWDCRWQPEFTRCEGMFVPLYIYKFHILRIYYVNTFHD